MGTPAQTLYNYCNVSFAKARDAARMEDKVNARKYLFEVLNALQVLYNAEFVEDRRNFYESKANEIYEIARDIRIEGFSSRIHQLFRDKDEYATYMEAPAAMKGEPLTKKPPNTVTDYMEKIKNSVSLDDEPLFTLEETEKKPVDSVESLEPEIVVKEEPPKQEEEHMEEFPMLNLPEVPKESEDDKEELSEETQKQSTPTRYEAGGAAMRPQGLKDYLGQPQAVAVLADAIKKIRLSGGALPHILLYGSQGLGKTTLAKILANEMQTEFIEISNARALTVDGLTQMLLKLQEGDIVFIDEIHNVQPAIAEGVLYSAMEDFSLRYVQGKQNKFKELPKFTLVGATTEAGKLLKPFKDRFGLDCRLVPYTNDILASIAINSFSKMGMSISQELAMELAKRARNTPRIVNRFASRIADKALVKTAEERGITEKGALSNLEKIRALDIWVSADVIEQYFHENGIDEYGLTDGDRALLKVLIETFNGGPAGQENLAKAMNESVNVISQHYENYLLKLGFINVIPKGRVAMPKAYRYLGLSVPEHIKEYDTSSSEAETLSEDEVEECVDEQAENLVVEPSGDEKLIEETDNISQENSMSDSEKNV